MLIGYFMLQSHFKPKTLTSQAEAAKVEAAEFARNLAETRSQLRIARQQVPALILTSSQSYTVIHFVTIALHMLVLRDAELPPNQPARGWFGVIVFYFSLVM